MDMRKRTPKNFFLGRTEVSDVDIYQKEVLTPSHINVLNYFILFGPWFFTKLPPGFSIFHFME